MPNERDSDQFVTLGLGHEIFAVPVGTVREILDMRRPFRIPEAPAHVVGLIDVRGRAVPLVDLRLRLGLARREPDADTRILVLDVSIDGRGLAFGLVADRVFEVTSLDAGSRVPPPDVGTAWHCDYIEGIGRHGESFVVIFDLARLLSGEDVAVLRRAEQRAEHAALAEASACA